MINFNTAPDNDLPLEEESFFEQIHQPVKHDFPENESWGDETLDDAIRTKEQPFGQP